MAKEILTFGGEKGGTGKSTAATNFACILARLGFSTLLINADEQKTATKFTQARSEDQPDAPQYGCVSLFDKAVRTEILKIRDNYDYIVIDTGGRDTTSQRAALSVSTIALCPFAPRDFDLETLDKVEAIVGEAQATNPNLKVYSFINQADPQGQGTENEDAAARLRKSPVLTYLDTIIGRRKAFSKAASSGLAVTELSRKDYDPKAAEEMMALFSRCCDVSKTSDTRRFQEVG